MGTVVLKNYVPRFFTFKAYLLPTPYSLLPTHISHLNHLAIILGTIEM